MYDVTIINGNMQYVIHDHRGAQNAAKLISASIVDAVNSISSFTFTILPNNIGYDKIRDYTTLVTVYNTKRARYDFIGRVLMSSQSMESDGLVSKTVTCEDRLGYLHDSIQPFAEIKHYIGDESRTGIEEFIDVLLANHNSQVESYKRIYRGNVTVKPFDSSDDVTKGLNWQTTYSAITEKLVKSFGGYIVLRESSGKLYLDYLNEVGTTRSTTIEVGRNMRSGSKEIDPSAIVTRLVPLGAKLRTVGDDGSEVESEERLTIASVNNGLNYIVSDGYEERYGIRYSTQIWDDVTDPNNLLSKGIAWLAANNGVSVSHTIDALELSLIDLDIDDFTLYDRYPVKNQIIGINDLLQIIKKTTNVIEPHTSSIELGDTIKRLSDLLIDEILASIGKDGKNSYVHIRYSPYADGSEMTVEPTEESRYIGLHIGLNGAAPTDPAEYIWSLFRGSDGAPGAPGEPGESGTPGVGVDRIVPRYAKGASNTVPPSTPSVAGWSITAPELAYGEYLWCAYYVVYTDGTDAFTEPFHARSADQITQASEAPENPTVGTLWLDTSVNPYVLLRWNGTEWEKVADYAKEFEEIYTYVNTSIANLQIGQDEILASVEEKTVAKSIYEEFASSVRNILQMEADGTTMLFQTINEVIQQVGDTEATHYAELLTYIQFNEDGIGIGKKGNAITMKLDNDSLDFYNNGTRVAYISDNQLYITDGRFLRSVRIGNYGFIPEANGSVSFTYLGGEV